MASTEQYKDFTLNNPGRNPNWSKQENQTWKDVVDTVVLDACSALKDTTNGHRHYKIYASDGSPVAITVDATGNVTFNQHAASASSYKAVYVDGNGAITLGENQGATGLTMFNVKITTTYLTVEVERSAHYQRSGNICSLYFNQMKGTTTSHGSILITPSTGTWPTDVIPIVNEINLPIPVLAGGNFYAGMIVIPSSYSSGWILYLPDPSDGYKLKDGVFGSGTANCGIDYTSLTYTIEND
jgi:hypothetical protein